MSEHKYSEGTDGPEPQSRRPVVLLGVVALVVVLLLILVVVALVNS